MILMWATSILRAIGRGECHLGPKKSRFSGLNPSNVPSNGFALIKIIKSKLLIKAGTLVILCTRHGLQLCGYCY